MKIHTYTSREQLMHVNAFVIETEKGVIVVDTTLTMSDSLAFRKMIEAFQKPILGILLTHGHPDHIAGTYNIAAGGEVPIFALQSVYDLMKATEAAKHAQWSSVFGTEWIPKWVYPNQIVKDSEVITLGNTKLRVLDLGAGGDCDANSIWLMEDEPAAFIGDLIYNNNHTYMADGSILRWLANLEKLETVLQSYKSYYVGHGSSCDFKAIAKQKEYFLTYCANALKTTHGSGIFTDETKKDFEQIMIEKFPDYGCQFMVGLSAGRVGQELIGGSVH
jgi:glyoxylase-like metal-dependent hydrolase (beta-lactamase superfamily II)